MRRSVNITWAELKVGLVIMVGFVIFTLAILSFGTIRNLFVPRVPVEVVFSNVKGLKAGAPVWIAGVEMGNVKQIKFPTGGQASGIRVIMDINTAMRGMIKTDSTATILTQGLLGDQYIEIELGSTSAPPLTAGTLSQMLQWTSRVGQWKLRDAGRNQLVLKMSGLCRSDLKKHPESKRPDQSAE
jgi:phospholipid/cholesterol/gamma-HCH transport system substrate-binding protein